MTRPKGRSAALAWAEWGLAAVLTLIALLLHESVRTGSGALWRDEANSVGFAGMASLREVLAHLQYDGFPLLSTLVLRGWMATPWGSTDEGLRAFGLIVGIALLGAIWLAARLYRCSAPVLSIALLGLNVVAIRAADSIRPYGLGMTLIVVAIATLWRVVESPTPRRVGLAAIVSILSVQCLYQNAFLLFGACLAGIAVSARRAGSKGAAATAIVGFAAAISLVPYAPSIRAAQSWNVLNQGSADLTRLLAVLGQALGGGGPAGAWLWVGLFAACCVTAASRRRSSRRPGPGSAAPGLSWFCVGATTAALAAFLVALRSTRLPTQVWYYAPLMAAAAPMLDAAAWTGATSRTRRLVRLALAVVIAGAALPGLRAALERRTNVDQVAARVATQASREDLVVVYPWYIGVSFQRYYAGAASWTTLPPLEDLRIHRYDLLKAAMSSRDATGSTLGRMAATLQTGHRVWLVGGLPPVGTDPPGTPPPAPHPVTGWNNGPYLAAWGRQATYLLQSHALSAEPLPIPGTGPVNPFENVSVVAVSGWQ